MSEQMPEQMSPDVTSDDKLWAALAYFLSPLVPILLFFLDDKKDRPFIRAHNAQALIMGLVITLIATVTLGCGSIAWVIMLFWAYKAYQGEMINIPLITDFVKSQGWA